MSEFLDKSEKMEIINAINAGCDVISGMHQFLNDDDDLRSRAEKRGVQLIDLRMAPNPPHFPTGSWQNRKIPVLLIVGTDCDTGKMTTAWELSKRLKDRGRKIEFIGTGQTGILLSDGVAIDAVVSDFVAGEVENLIDSKLINETDLFIDEGQGALSNYAYSGVTLGLIHGCMPDYFILTHDPSRSKDVMGQPLPNVKECMQLHIDLMSQFKKTSFIGINLLTYEMNDEEASKRLDIKSGGLIYWIACIRECFEESGILLADNEQRKINLGSLTDPELEIINQYKKKLLDGKDVFLELIDKFDLTLSTSEIAYISHWITPKIEKRRYSTRFFIARCPNQLASHDGLEGVESRWLEPKVALDLYKSGEFPMIMPTIKNLELIKDFQDTQTLLLSMNDKLITDIPKVEPVFDVVDGKPKLISY